MSQLAVKSSEEKFCKDCGSLIHSKAEICPKCGIRQISQLSSLEAAAPNGKNKTTAALLAIFLGSIGIHKFYLGSTVQGIIYILFCWTGIPAVIGLIEGIILLTMNSNAFVQRYGMA